MCTYTAACSHAYSREERLYASSGVDHGMRWWRQQGDRAGKGATHTRTQCSLQISLPAAVTCGRISSGSRPTRGRQQSSSNQEWRTRRTASRSRAAQGEGDGRNTLRLCARMWRGVLLRSPRGGGHKVCVRNTYSVAALFKVRFEECSVRTDHCTKTCAQQVQMQQYEIIKEASKTCTCALKRSY